MLTALADTPEGPFVSDIFVPCAPVMERSHLGEVQPPVNQ